MRLDFCNKSAIRLYIIQENSPGGTERAAMEEHILIRLSSRYPQLLFPVANDTKDCQEYKDAVFRGKRPDRLPQFSFSPMDRFQTEETPAGPADILCLKEREDFIHCLRALAYQCEPRDIPQSVGANTIRGLINWEKIDRHKMTYLLAGGQDWAAELKRFTADKVNYCDTLIILSTGPYSAVPAELLGYDMAAWNDISLQIRKYHELTHFVCRSLFPERIDTLRDEVMADMIGLLAALDRYDTDLARLFLGIEGNSFRPGGRLSFYTAPDETDAAAARASSLIDGLAERLMAVDRTSVFDVLLALY